MWHRADYTKIDFLFENNIGTLLGFKNVVLYTTAGAIYEFENTVKIMKINRLILI